jgi:hypothetical protein
MHTLQHPGKPWELATIVGWVIGAAVEWFAFGSEKQRHWPTTLPRQALDGSHIDGIDIGALDISATAIRQGLSADVPEIVWAFIRENALYDN